MRWKFCGEGRIIFVAMFLLSSYFSALAASTNRYVSLSGGNRWPYTNWADAGTNIVEVVNLANSYNEGDVVVVSNGTYALTNSIWVSYATVSNFNTNRSATVILGNNQNRCVFMSNAYAAVHGFTITNGTADFGGGVLAYGGLLNNCAIVGNCATGSSASWGNGGGGVKCQSSTIITNCLIMQNIATQDAFGAGVNCDVGQIYNSTIIGNTAYPPSWAGGVFAKNCNIYDSMITANSAYDGGGAYVAYSSSIRDCFVGNNAASRKGGGLALDGLCSVQGCIIISNTALTNGGGVTIDGGARKGPCLLENSLVVENWSRYGGGAYCIKYNGTSTGIVANCTVVSNSCDIAGGGVYVASTVKCFMTNSIVYFNSGPYSNVYELKSAAFSCVAPTNGFTENNLNNISDNPQFSDLNGRNYRLTVNSPCVNTGTNQDWMTNSFDLDGRQRIRYGTVDMGAYETIYEGTIYRIP